MAVSIESPCVKVCVIDRRDGVCAGCGRTLAEISAWSRMSPADRRRIMAALPGRLTAAGAP